PGCDATHIAASLQAGADGIVLAALGSGNANP
ncbi:asparaginase, partial [Rhizobium sp. BR5]